MSLPLTGALAVARWFHVISLMIVFGSAALAALLRRDLPSSSLRASAAPVALLGAALWFVLSAAVMNDGLSDAGLWLALTQSQFGQVFMARAILLVLLCVGVWRGWRESLVGLLSGAALALIAVTSHAAEASPAGFTAIGTITDGLHLLTAGFWIGGLVALGLFYGARESDFAASVARFAGWGMGAVTLLILTGMLNATTILLGSAGTDSKIYLAILGAKLVGVAAMLALALTNHFRLLPRLGQAGMAGRLDRNIRRELLLGLGVVALAVMLSLIEPTF